MPSLVSFNALYGGYPLLSYKTKRISFVLSKPKFLIYFLCGVITDQKAK